MFFLDSHDIHTSVHGIVTIAIEGFVVIFNFLTVSVFKIGR